MTDYDYELTDWADFASPEEKQETRIQYFSKNLEELYEKVVAKGFRIDVRNRNSFLLIKGQWARSFRTFTEACYFALEPDWNN